jgi:hypothetical protein
VYWPLHLELHLHYQDQHRQHRFLRAKKSGKARGMKIAHSSRHSTRSPALHSLAAVLMRSPLPLQLLATRSGKPEDSMTGHCQQRQHRCDDLA